MLNPNLSRPNTLEFKAQQVKKQLELPFKSKDKYSKLYAYLSKTRGIDNTIIPNMIHRKQLYQDTKNHCVFVGYDKNNNPAYAFKRSTTPPNFKYQFKGDLKGSNKEVGLLVKNSSTSLFVSEAVIDSLSIMTILHHNNKDFNAYDYLALGGTSTKALEYHLADNNYSKIYICTDNDKPGFEARDNIKKLLHQLNFKGQVFNKVPKNKDFNNDLLEMKNISFTQPQPQQAHNHIQQIHRSHNQIQQDRL